MPEIEVRIVDPATGADVPAGADGELWARGYVVMKGYYKMPDATAAAITTDGWLRSGDQASIDREGRVRITGRIKDIIIRGGENIAPKEVEDVLRTHPAIADASVYAVTSEFFGEEVAAALRLHPGASIDAGRGAGVLSRAAREVQGAAIHQGRRRLPADGVRKDPEVSSARSARGRLRIVRSADRDAPLPGSADVPRRKRSTSPHGTLRRPYSFSTSPATLSSAAAARGGSPNPRGVASGLRSSTATAKPPILVNPAPASVMNL